MFKLRHLTIKNILQNYVHCLTRKITRQKEEKKRKKEQKKNKKHGNYEIYGKY